MSVFIRAVCLCVSRPILKVVYVFKFSTSVGHTSSMAGL